MKKSLKMGLLLATLSVTLLAVGGCTQSPKNKTGTSDTEQTIKNVARNGYKNVTKEGEYVVGKNGAVPLSEVDKKLPIVEVYFDPICPGCAAFERATGEYLEEVVSEGKVLVRYHPLRFLDSASTDNYSSRASAYLVGVAEHAPEVIGKMSSAIYDPSFMPEEGTGYKPVDNSAFDALLIKLGGNKEQAAKINEDLEDNIKVVFEATNNVILNNKLKKQSPTGSIFTPFVIPNKAGEDDSQALAFEDEATILSTFKESIEEITK